jgi:hypothetical protein
MLVVIRRSCFVLRSRVFVYLFVFTIVDCVCLLIDSPSLQKSRRSHDLYHPQSLSRRNFKKQYTSETQGLAYIPTTLSTMKLQKLVVMLTTLAVSANSSSPESTFFTAYEATSASSTIQCLPNNALDENTPHKWSVHRHERLLRDIGTAST